uniref:Lipoprotein n=1 Tax=Magnetococcus massalia (strain MO-1) TaxID=451514 RepID=A0A1S7LJ96_MAGMO|nr:conserved exported protein of unknown function [Candidatus Magnetococcus massalia]
MYAFLSFPRGLLIGFSLLLLSGCAVEPWMRSAQSYWLKQWQSEQTSRKPQAFSVEYVKSLPYASMMVTTAGQAQSLLILQERAGDTLTWVGSDRSLLVTQGGRLTKTVGLADDLTATRIKDDSSLRATDERSHLQMETSRFVDYRQHGVFDLHIQCRLLARGQESVTILDQTHRLKRLDEQCRAVGKKWSFTNSFWMDPQGGFIWKSIQHYIPEHPPLVMQITRPAQ